jgi:hypothetical protein
VRVLVDHPAADVIAMRAIVIAAIVSSGCGVSTTPSDAGADLGAAADAYVARDAGSDVGLDGGVDAGVDGGDDASLDASSDDASFDAGPIDACGPMPVNAPDSGIARTSIDAGSASAAPIAPFATCAISLATDTIEGHEHLSTCFPIPYPNEPPSAGPHYPYPYNWGTYDAAIPWGFAVHDLEHGGVILAYHCENDADCDPVRAEFASILQTYVVDDCVTRTPTATNIIIEPDPTLPVPIAAIAWENVYEATCLDPPSLRAFVAAHYNMAPENFFVSLPDGGTCAYF